MLKDGESEYNIKIHIKKENLLVSSKLKESKVTSLTLSNWEDKDEDELKKELVSILKQQNINYTPSDEKNDIFQILYLALNTSSKSFSDFNSIRKLDGRYSIEEKVLNVFCLIFRNLLDEQAKQNPEKALKLLKTFCYNRKYRIPFYKRISLYIICENWETTKSLFFELIKENDALHLFSIDNYQKDLYDLLNRNCKALNGDEIKIIENIIEQGKQYEIEGQAEEHNRYWKLGWYSALKDTETFKDKYLSLSRELNITSEHFERLGEVRVIRGNRSPISKDNLLEKSNQEIVDYIKKFNPQRGFYEPNISGLSKIFGEAVETDPKKFATEIELYQDIPYIYSYQIFNAFCKAWQKQKTFDWEKVLQYCLTTLNSPKFYSEELEIENDDWHTKSDSVVGSIANLITNGLDLENDEHAFNTNLLPLAKEIVQIIVSNLKYVDDLEETNMDYPSYLLNSTAGKSLRALFNYSLYRAKNLFKPEDKEKWETDIKLLFEETLQKRIIDGYILEGMYFDQFCLLDYDWITEQVKKHYTSEDREWFAFMGGFAYSRAPYNKELYTIFYPHYERAIDNNVKLKKDGDNDLIHHLTAFYFWKYETLASKKLFFKFINNASPSQIRNLINFIRKQEDYPNSLSELEQQEFQQSIIDLWKFLTDKYENSQDEKEQNNLASLSNWIVFVPKLNGVYTPLILKSCKHIDNTYSKPKFLENIFRLKAKGNPNTTAKAIGEILLSLNFKDYITENDRDFIKELVSFLFANGQKEIASGFCNKMSSENQHYFLREIYEANTK